MPDTADGARRAALDTFWRALVDCHNNLPALLEVVAQQVVDVLGDGCIITTVTEDGASLHPRVIRHADAQLAEATRATLAGEDVHIGEGLAGTAALDRRPVVLNDLDRETMEEATIERFKPFFREHPVRRIMVVPLLAGGELVGTLGAFGTTEDSRYSHADVRMLEALAERAALAIHRAVAGPRAVGPADFEALYLHNLDAVFITTPDGHTLAANPAACAMLGLTEREIIDRGREGLMVGDDPRLGPALAQRAASGHARSELAMRRGDGEIFVADVSSTIFTTPDGRARAVVIARDVSDEVAAREGALAREAELEQVANRDDLTGLLNRRGFAVAAQQALAAADRAETMAQLLFVDIDDMKGLNDAHGHSMGDAALIAVASAIDQATRDADVACRLGGDEFLVLLVDDQSDDVQGVVDRIHDVLGRDPSAPAGVSISTGVVERPPHTEATLAELIDAADREMYQRKVLRRLRHS